MKTIFGDKAEKPTVAIIWMGDCFKYCVIGTNYGYIHTSGGGVRVWNSYSGAWRAARSYTDREKFLVGCGLR